PEQGHDLGQLVNTNGPSFVERIQNARRLTVEADMPAPVRILDLRPWLDADVELHQMPQPPLDHPRERIEGRLLEAKLDDRVETAPARPAHLLVLLAENIQPDRAHPRAGL